MIRMAVDEHELVNFKNDATTANPLFDNPAQVGDGGARWGVDRNTIQAYRGLDNPLRQNNIGAG